MYPWPDFLEEDTFDEDTWKTWFKEKFPPLQWKGKRTSFWDSVEDQKARGQMYSERVRPTFTPEPGTTVTQKGDPHGNVWRPPPVVTFEPMHVMRATFKAKCFAFIAGDTQALDNEPKRALYWQGEYVSYYSHAFLMDSSLSEEEVISKTLNKKASTMLRMEGISKCANSWDNLTHFGDVPPNTTRNPDLHRHPSPKRT